VSPSPFVNERVRFLSVSCLIEDGKRFVRGGGGVSPSATAALRAASINNDGSLGFSVVGIVMVMRLIVVNSSKVVERRLVVC